MYNERGAHDAGPMAPPGGACAAESVSWSPCGRLLAACSRKSRVIHCWDVSAGAYSPLGGGAAGVSEVAFSPCGGYLFAAHVGEAGFAQLCAPLSEEEQAVASAAFETAAELAQDPALQRLVLDRLGPRVQRNLTMAAAHLFQFKRRDVANSMRLV